MCFAYVLVHVVFPGFQLTANDSEPEFRLVWMAPACVLCGLGMFLFGYALQTGASAVVCAFLQGLMMVGVLIGIFSTLSYGLDAFRSQSNEIFIMNMFFKVRVHSPSKDEEPTN